MRKRLFPILAALLLLTSAAQAAEREAAAETAPVRVAVIDSGISTEAVSAERIAAGYNYIRPQDDTEDKLGHGTAVAAIIAGSEKARITGICPTAALNLTSCVRA